MRSELSEVTPKSPKNHDEWKRFELNGNTTWIQTYEPKMITQLFRASYCIYLDEFLWHIFYVMFDLLVEVSMKSTFTSTFWAPFSRHLDGNFRNSQTHVHFSFIILFSHNKRHQMVITKHPNCPEIVATALLKIEKYLQYHKNAS